MSWPLLDQGWPLLLLPILVLPFLRFGQDRVVHPSLALLPADRLSWWFDWLIRALAAVAMGCLIVGLAGPHLPERFVERNADGVQVMLVIDRSRSMGDHFEGQSGARRHEMARELAQRLVTARPEHLYGVIGFSTTPLRALRPTPSNPAVLAAVRPATDSGLALTEVAAPLVQALDSFHGSPGESERVLLLVSDGELGVDGQHAVRLRLWTRDAGVRLLWLRFPSPSDGVVGRPSGWETLANEGVPFPDVVAGLEIPRREVLANDENAVEQLLAELDGLKPGRVTRSEVIPRQDLATPLYLAAALLLLGLTGLRAMELERWA